MLDITCLKPGDLLAFSGEIRFLNVIKVISIDFEKNLATCQYPAVGPASNNDLLYPINKLAARYTCMTEEERVAFLLEN